MPEGSILAHVGRALAVAGRLDPERFEIVFAASGDNAFWLKEAGCEPHPVHTVKKAHTLARLQRGGSAFDENTLREYVRDEIRVLEELCPNVVVGDFRASLSISAAIAHVSYVCVTNAVWSKYVSFPLDPPRSWRPGKFLPKPLLGLARSMLESRVFAYYARPFNRVRKEYGLPPQADIRDCMSSDELTLFADLPEFFPTDDARRPAHCRYVGPIVWEPDHPLPPWWDDLDRSGKRRIVYVTMGSTGKVERIRAIAKRLLERDCQVVCTSAKADGPNLTDLPGVFSSPYLPGSRMCAAADVVACHAGNGTIYQALSQGTPVVGLAEFHDQDFNMQRVEALGVGLRPTREDDPADVAETVGRVLSDPGFRKRAERLSARLREFDGPRAAAEAIAEFAGRH